MTYSKGLSFIALAAFLALAGCSPPWMTLVQSGPPSALGGTRSFDVAFDFSRMILDGQPVDQVMQTVPPDERADLEGVFQERMKICASNLGALTARFFEREQSR